MLALQSPDVASRSSQILIASSGNRVVGQKLLRQEIENK